MRTGGPQGPGPNRSPNGDKKPVPGAGRWPCLHTGWPGSADKTIHGHDLRGSARSDATPPTDAAMPMQLHRQRPPARCPHSAVNTCADVRSRAEQGLRVPRSPTSPRQKPFCPRPPGQRGPCRWGRRRRQSPAQSSQVFGASGRTATAQPPRRAWPQGSGARGKRDADRSAERRGG